MSLQPNHKTKFIFLTVSVTSLVLVFAVTWSRYFIPNAEQLIPMEEVEGSHKNGSSAQVNELDQATSATIQKAEDLTKQANQLISKTVPHKSSINGKTMQNNKEMTTQLADMRSRLDALKK